MLKGQCNQCGLCCMDGTTRCENLVIRGKLGTPDATYCSKYKQRYNGMPIRMINAKGEIIDKGYCSTSSVQEEIEILVKGIGRGCSMTIAQGEYNGNGRS